MNFNAKIDTWKISTPKKNKLIICCFEVQNSEYVSFIIIAIGIYNRKENGVSN